MRARMRRLQHEQDEAPIEKEELEDENDEASAACYLILNYALTINDDI